MNKNIILIISIVFFLYFNCNAQKIPEKIYSEVGKLTPIEAKILKNIADKDEGSIEYTLDVKRYYKIKNGIKSYINNEILYKEKDGFIAESFVYYELSFVGVENNMSINYRFSSGTAYSGKGTVNLFGDTILQTEITWGTGAKTLTTFFNNSKVFEKTISF